MIRAGNVLSISWQHLNHPNLCVCSLYQFHVYFHVGITVHHLGIAFPHDDGYSKVKNSNI